MTLSEENKEEARIIKFRKPGSEYWHEFSIETKPGKSNAMQSNDELNDMLLRSLQMPNLVALTGAGCSLSAAGPSMGDLWAKAINGGGDKPTEDAEEILETISFPLKTNEEGGNNIEEYLSKIEAYLYVHDDAENVKAFLRKCKDVILHECSSFLIEDTKGAWQQLHAHTTLLQRLAKRRTRDNRLKIFTTNYDLCFERAAALLGLVVLDGFSFTTPRQYDPKFYTYDIIRRIESSNTQNNYLEGVFLLYKIHGSVNWVQRSNGTVYEKHDPNADEACIIYPAKGKYQKSFTQPHLESMSQYLKAIREPNTCMLVIGSGFNDSHLAEPLLEAVRSNPQLRLIVVDPSAKNNVGDKSLKKNKRYWHQLSKMSTSGTDIWFIAATFDQFASIIPDLKALTPAENLAQAVQTLIKVGDEKSA